MTKHPPPSQILALAGNPNTGKSSVFNALTGAKQHVGNWPGKTVERVDGRFAHRGVDFEIVDLPGAYSLNASSPEEMIARDYLIGGEPHGVLVVADAANLERNLYLVIQVIEIGLPTIVILNMSDVARSRGIVVDPNVLAQQLSTPVVATVARSGEGLDLLKDTIVSRFTLEESR